VLGGGRVSGGWCLGGGRVSGACGSGSRLVPDGLTYISRFCHGLLG
jgi:hypothetical protein